jgi:hypothetical protein
MSIALLHRRRVRDMAFFRWKAFPKNDGVPTWIDSMNALGGDIVFLPVDLGEMSGAFRPEGLGLLLEIDAAPSLADGQRIVFTLQHADDMLHFVDTQPLVEASIVGTGGEGFSPAGYWPGVFGLPATTIMLAAPLALKRYLVIAQTCDVGDGDPSLDGGATFSVVF